MILPLPKTISTCSCQHGKDGALGQKMKNEKNLQVQGFSSEFA